MKLLTHATIKLGQIFSKIPDIILYNSSRSILQHREMGFVNENDYFIPNGFDTNLWRPDIEIKVKMRKELGIIDQK